MAKQRSSSDPEMENIDPGLDLVSFEGVAPCYSPLEDIVVRYRLGAEVSPTRHDWVGLFPSGWGTTEDYLTYVWAPLTTQEDKCSVTFAANQLQALPANRRQFMFLFVCRGNFVAGVSRKFSMAPGGNSDRTPSANSSLPLSDNSSFTLVSSDDSLDTQGFEDVAELIENAPSQSESFELDCQSNSSLLLSQLFALPCDPEDDPQLEAITSNSCKTKATVAEKTDRKQGSVSRTEEAPLRVTHDTLTLAGTFKEAEGLKEQLCFVHHKIVRDYAENKEKSLVPYIPIFNLQLSNSQSVLKITKKDNDPRRNLSLVPFICSHGRSLSWMQIEMMPVCCALCNSARSLMEVYRRQLAICTTEIKQLKLDVFCLRKALELKEDQAEIYKSRELKYKKTEETIEEVMVQVSYLENDINNLLLQNSLLENERNQLQVDLHKCRKDLAECQKKFSITETQLSDVLFSLSLKGYSSLIDFTGNEINLLEIDGEPIDVDGWQLYKNKRCGRLLAIINHQEKNIKKLRASQAEKEDVEGRLQSDVDNKQKLLEMVKTQVGSLMDEVIELKGRLTSSLKREEHHLRLLASGEVERSQVKYETETREHHLITQIQELKEALAKKPENSLVASTHRLVSTGLAIVSDACRPSWCSSLCPTVGKRQQHVPVVISLPQDGQPKITRDSVSWENEEPVAKQPRVCGSKKATKRSHKEIEHSQNPQIKGVHHRKRTNFPENCPVCGISFSSAIDSRVIDEHLAFHDVYRA